MRKVWCGLLLLLLWGSVGRVLAVNLDQATVRLSRIQTGASPLPVLIMVKTATGATENGLRIQVGAGWTVDSNKNNLTIRTTGLPSGVTAWPGMGTAVNVSGQVIDFPSANLNAGTNYGFYITGGIGVNTAVGDGANYKWGIITLAGGNPSDQTEVKIPIIASDTISISGRVGAKASDFQLELTADKSGNLSVGDQVIYQINYGTYLTSAIKPLVITAEWSRGTVSGSPVPSVDIADYVVGSGTTAWGGVEPVIDLVNRKITWTINPFPANTVNQRVEFKLTVNNSYSGSSDVNYTVSSDLNGANVVSMSSSVSNIYHPASPTATPLPTTVPTSSPSSSTTISSGQSPTSIPTPTPTTVPMNIKKIEVVTLSDSGVGIETSTNEVPETLKIVYGELVSTLNSSMTSINGIKNELLNIEGLKPETNYFFKVLVTDDSGKVVGSDTYTFKTAAVSDQPEIDQTSMVVSSADNVLMDAKSENNSTNATVLTQNEPYVIRINLSKSEIVKSIKVSVRNAQVLGINTVYGAEPNSTEDNLVEVGNGGFVGHLVAPKEEGFYEVIVRIEDTNGNISEKKNGEIKVMAPLMVVDENEQPVENAKVIFYKYNQTTKTYDLIGREMFGVQNPSYTEASGQVSVNFPKGGYRIEVSAIGFSPEEVSFNIGLGKDEKLPKVVMGKMAIGLPILLSYYGGVAVDTVNFSKTYLNNLATSGRFFKLMSLMVAINGVVALWLFTANYYSIYWWLLPKKIIYRFSRKQKNILRGTVSDATTKMPLGGVKVYLVDEKFNKVLSKSITDKLGEFSLLIKASKGYRLAAIKDGFEPTPMLDFTSEGITAGRVDLKMKEVVSVKEKIENALEDTFKRIRGWLWSVWLVWLAAMELIFWKNFGLGLTWWGVVISILSLGWWLTVILKKHAVEKD